MVLLLQDLLGLKTCRRRWEPLEVEQRCDRDRQTHSERSPVAALWCRLRSHKGRGKTMSWGNRSAMVEGMVAGIGVDDRTPQTEESSTLGYSVEVELLGFADRYDLGWEREMSRVLSCAAGGMGLLLSETGKAVKEGGSSRGTRSTECFSYKSAAGTEE